MYRLGAILLGVTLGGCLLGPSADTSPEAAAEAYRANPAAFDSLRTMAREDIVGHVYLEVRTDRPAADLVASWGETSTAPDSARLGVERDRRNHYHALLTEADAKGVTAWRGRDSTYHVEVWIAASGIAVSGCTLRLISGREPFESTSGNFTEHLDIGGGWFAEEVCT